jgi:hypothetical protein
VPSKETIDKALRRLKWKAARFKSPALDVAAIRRRTKVYRDREAEALRQPGQPWGEFR